MSTPAFIRANPHLLHSQVARSYADLKMLLNSRRVQLKMSMLDVDARSGWADGYAGKVFGDTRSFSRESLGLILQTLGVGIVLLAEDEQSQLGCQGVDLFHRKRMQELGRKGGLARRKQLTGAQWKELCRAAGKQSAAKRRRKKELDAVSLKRLELRIKRKLAAMAPPAAPAED